MILCISVLAISDIVVKNMTFTLYGEELGFAPYTSQLLHKDIAFSHVHFPISRSMYEHASWKSPSFRDPKVQGK